MSTNDLTLRQYVQLSLVQELQGVDETDKLLTMLSVLTGKSSNELNELTQEEFKVKYDQLFAVEPINPDPISEANGFKLPDNLAKYPLRAWIPLEAHVLKNDPVLSSLSNSLEHAPKVLAVACMPADATLKEFRESERYEDWASLDNIHKRVSEFEQMPAHKALGLYAFFLKWWRSYNATTQRYSKVMMAKKKLAQLVRNTLKTIRGVRFSLR